jgi:hypothetical protein
MINKPVPGANPLTGIPPFARNSERFPEAGVGEVLGQATHPQGIVALVVLEIGHSPPAIRIAALLRGVSDGLSGVFHVRSRSGTPIARPAGAETGEKFRPGGRAGYAVRRRTKCIEALRRIGITEPCQFLAGFVLG